MIEKHLPKFNQEELVVFNRRGILRMGKIMGGKKAENDKEWIYVMKHWIISSNGMEEQAIEYYRVEEEDILYKLK